MPRIAVLAIASSLFFLFLPVPTAGAQAVPGLLPGVVVEKIAGDSEGSKARLQEGDIILSWARGDVKGEVESPFDLMTLEIEQAPLGPVSLQGIRAARPQTWTLGPDTWGLDARPNFTSGLLASYRQAQSPANASRFSQLTTDIQKLLGTGAWISFQRARKLNEATQWEAADKSFAESVQEAAEDRPRIAVIVLETWAQALLDRGDLKAAEQHYQQALAEQRKIGLQNLTTAKIVAGLGTTAWQQGDLSKAEDYYRQALELTQKLAPDSLSVADSLNGLGNVAHDQGNLNKAEDYYCQSLEIRLKLAPGTIETAQSLNNLGLVARQRGDMDRAEHYLRQDLAITERLAPHSLELATSLNNLGLVAYDRGDLAKAEEYYHRDLAITGKLAPHSLRVATSLNNLGNVAWLRGDLAKSENYYRQSLEIRTKLAPDSIETAVSLSNLGNIARERRDLAKAEDYHRQSLAIRERLAPNSIDVSYSLSNLGHVAYLRQNLAEAEHYFKRALEIREKLAPGSVMVARSLSLLGNLMRTRGDLDTATGYYLRAREIWDKVAPATKNQADTLGSLASIAYQRGRVEEASRLFQQTLDALEGQTARLGGNDQTRSDFRVNYAEYYNEYMRLLVKQDQMELAFEILERSRGRSWLEMLAVSHLKIQQGVDAALVERERSLRADIAAKSDRRIRLFTRKASQEQLAAIGKELDSLLAQYRDVETEIRAASPAYAALTQPQPMSAKEVEHLLDAETVLLEYSLGEEHSHVFAVTADSVSAYQLPPKAEIEAMARQIYRIWTAQSRIVRQGNATGRQARLRQERKNSARLLAELSRVILGPVAAQLKHKRLLIVSDGALQYIPFAALPSPNSLDTALAQDCLPLVTEHEIINLPSASLLATLRRSGAARKKAPKAVAVLADPVFAKDDARVAAGAPIRNSSQRLFKSERKAKDDDIHTRDTAADWTALLTRAAADLGILRQGRPYLPRLPFSRREADAILSVTPKGQGMEALDFRASLATATSPDLSRYRVVHFATHGLLNSEHPELSGLVLSLVDPSGKSQSGFLGLEDIYNLNLSADLVVLSACETALGKEIQGEGLVGLTRGFMYAGASQVVASLWSVDDEATAELMRLFYKAMEQDGLRPAAALRRAQMEVRKQQRWSQPYYWAGFVIQGDW